MCMALYLPVIVCFRHCIYTVTELSAVMMYAWSAVLRCCLHFVEQWNGHSDLELIERVVASDVDDIAVDSV